MNERLKTLYGVAVAGLLHDIGKLYQRADDNAGSTYLTQQSRTLEDTVCPPHWNGSGGCTHKHALWTMAFWERHGKYLPVSLGEPLAMKEMDTAENSSSYHHNPISGHPRQKLMQIADHCSAGMDRTRAKDADENQDQERNFRTVRLVPPWLQLGDENQNPTHEYPLVWLDSQDKRSFPVPFEQWRDRTTEYRKLAIRLEQELAGIGNAIPEHFVELRYEALVSALERATWCVPSSTMDDPSISLFDHLRGTAAIAAALADHAMTERSELDEMRFDEAAFRFLVIDIAGIQSFIYDMNPSGFKGTAKVLRARSFYVAAMLEAVEMTVLERLDLPRSQTLMNGGGKLVLLISARREHEERIEAYRKEMDAALVRQTHGRLRVLFGLGEPFTARVFKGKEGSLSAAYDSAFESLAIAKLSPLASQLIRDDGCFVPETAHMSADYGENGPCEACGKMPAVGVRHDQRLCSLCDFQVELGETLVTHACVHFEWAKEVGDFPGTNLKLRLSPKTVIHDGTCRAYQMWQPDQMQEGAPIRYLAHYVRRWDRAEISSLSKEMWQDYGQPDTGQVASFEALADRGIDPVRGGVCALGVISGDVDNLGDTFDMELKRPRGGLTTMMSISRQLNFFFGGVLEAHNRKENANIYTVYAGGDDFFAIGTWDEILDVASMWDELFKAFTCHRPAFHFSAGLCLARPGVPVHRLREQSEDLQQAAKNAGRNRVALWDKEFTWEKWRECVSEEAKKLEGWLSKDTLNSGQAYRLLGYARRARRALLENSVRLDDAMWLPHIRYDLARNLKDKKGKEKLHEHVHSFTCESNDSDKRMDFAEYFETALSWALYKTRGGERKEEVGK